MRDDFDSPWKEILRIFLKSVLTVCFPRTAALIDWNKPFEFLDKELEQITRDASAGKYFVDKLIKVQLLDGRIGVLFIHAEVQHRPDAGFPKRVFRYNNRAEDYCGQRVLSLGILADQDPNWRPDVYESNCFGCEIRFKFPVCKLLDLAERKEELLQGSEPAGIIIIADWAAGRTGQDESERMTWKWQLTRRLYESGQTKQQVLELYRLIDWLLTLSPGLETKYLGQVREYEQKMNMPYITSAEKAGLEQGLAQGRKEGSAQAKREALIEVLETRLGAVPESVRKRVSEVRDTSVLSLWLRVAAQCEDFEVFERSISG